MRSSADAGVTLSAEGVVPLMENGVPRTRGASRSDQAAPSRPGDDLDRRTGTEPVAEGTGAAAHRPLGEIQAPGDRLDRQPVGVQRDESHVLLGHAGLAVADWSEEPFAPRRGHCGRDNNGACVRHGFVRGGFGGSGTVHGRWVSRPLSAEGNVLIRFSNVNRRCSAGASQRVATRSWDQFAESGGGSHRRPSTGGTMRSNG